MDLVAMPTTGTKELYLRVDFPDELSNASRASAGRNAAAYLHDGVVF